MNPSDIEELKDLITTLREQVESVENYISTELPLIYETIEAANSMLEEYGDETMD